MCAPKLNLTFSSFLSVAARLWLCDLGGAHQKIWTRCFPSQDACVEVDVSFKSQDSGMVIRTQRKHFERGDFVTFGDARLKAMKLLFIIAFFAVTSVCQQQI